MNSKVERVIEEAKAVYEYETENSDAAENYETVLCSQYTNGEHELFSSVDGLDGFNVTMQFEHYGPEMNDDSDILSSVYLGQSEVEIQVEETLTAEEVAWIGHNSDFVVGSVGPSDSLLYQVFPSNLVVTARKGE